MAVEEKLQNQTMLIDALINQFQESLMPTPREVGKDVTLNLSYLDDGRLSTSRNDGRLSTSRNLTIMTDA